MILGANLLQRKKNQAKNIEYICMSMTDIKTLNIKFDFVYSSRKDN